MGYMNAVTEEDILSDCGCGDLDIFWKSSPLFIYICLRTDLFYIDVGRGDLQPFNFWQGIKIDES